MQWISSPTLIDIDFTFTCCLLKLLGFGGWLSVQADAIAEKKKLADKKQDQLHIIGRQGKASWELPSSLDVLLMNHEDQVNIECFDLSESKIRAMCTLSIHNVWLESWYQHVSIPLLWTFCSTLSTVPSKLLAALTMQPQCNSASDHLSIFRSTFAQIVGKVIFERKRLW